MTILSAVLHDLSLHLSMSYTELSIANSMVSIGAIFGSVMGSLLTKRMSQHLDLVHCIVHLMTTVALLAIPFSGNVILQSVEWCMQGLAMGIGYIGLLAVNYMVVMHLWPENVGPAVLFAATANSIGHTVGSLLPMPFVSQENAGDSSPFVYVPFLILAGMFSANGVNLLVQYVVGLRCHRCYEVAMSSSNKEPSEPEQVNKLQWLIVPGMGIVDFFVRVSDSLPAYLLPSIGIESRLHMPANRSDLVIVIYNVNRTTSKLLASFLLKKRLPAQSCLQICLAMTSILALIIFLVGLNSVTSFSAIVIAMGLFTGPSATLLMVWVNEYVKVDSYALSVWQVAENVGILSSVLVGGIVFDFYGSLPALLVNLVDGVIACTTFSILQCLMAMSVRIA
ncbi:hypothetical protein CAPTEDRAFT_215034 [Capitella teleta]|uniref:Major facilitator superfamily (MFS) profile domain-containing protein n=1 Tax=Capitella teleta TaxID=283909 RepID=R7TEI0_CAPTE|nr:hypothetical protein CAPTEDRAFT_215034 [Capitella teleta]|eukprot:ELT92173.1 hypothetical protein CAPTEDRAFT_215034 [Capitella teleta]